MRSRLLRIVMSVAALAAGLALTGPAPTPAGAAVGLYKAINLNGPTTVVDGVTFEAEASVPGLVAGPERSCSPAAPVPAAGAALQSVLQCFVWGVDNTGGVDVRVPVPNNFAYNVTLWTFENDTDEQVGLLVNGAPFQEISTGPPGTWRQIGPLPVIVTDGFIRIGSRYGAANISAIRIDNTEFPDGYIPLAAPARVLETRAGLPTADGFFQGQGIHPAGQTREVELAGRVNLPIGAASVALNVAATGSGIPGYVTVYPCGQPQPNISTLNYDAGQTVSNMALVKLGTNGRICVFALSDTHVVIDAAGYFATTGGFTPLASPKRVLETRSGVLPTDDGIATGAGANPGGQVLELQIGGRLAGAIPTSAASVALNVTATEPALPGFVTVFPCGEPVPTAANLNYGAGRTVGNAVVAKLSASGKVCFFTNATTHLVVDVSGYFADQATFVPVPAPRRVLETRPGLSTFDGAMNGIGIVPGGTVVTLPVANRAGIGGAAQAVTLNVAATEAVAPGFVTVFPCGAPLPTAASLNYVAGDSISNSVIAKVGAGGAVCLFTSASAHLVVDVSGTMEV